MQTHELSAHPAHPPLSVSRVTASISARDPNWLQLRWRIEGAGRIAVPALAGKGRRDGLWRTTCFELFISTESDEAYAEFNFSPSEEWAAYDFDSYRAGMAERVIPGAPAVSWRGGNSSLALFDAAIPVAGLPKFPWAYGLSAVIEEDGGRRSFWALAQPLDEPDFHDPACFAGRLAAPERP